MIGFFNGALRESARAYLRHLTWVSRHDASTRLPNRNALLDALGEITETKNTAGSFVLIIISLVDVMALRSAFGFEVIDEIIR